jgi:PqqD family protein of HPr-rel-A system
MARFVLRHSRLVLKSFEGEDQAVAYDPASDDTHLLTAVAVEVCRYLGEEPLDAAELVARLSADFPDDDPEMIRTAVDTAMQQLDSAELVRMVDA